MEAVVAHLDKLTRPRDLARRQMGYLPGREALFGHTQGTRANCWKRLRDEGELGLTSENDARAKRRASGGSTARIWQNAFVEARQHHDSAMATKAAEYAEQVEALKAAHAAEIQRLEAAREAEVRRLLSAHEAEVKDLTDQSARLSTRLGEASERLGQLGGERLHVLSHGGLVALEADLRRSLGRVNKAITAPASDCVICLNAPKAAVFTPCSHLCCCVACAEELFNQTGGESAKCPVCRQAVEAVLPVFM